MSNPETTLQGPVNEIEDGDNEPAIPNSGLADIADGRDDSAEETPKRFRTPLRCLSLVLGIVLFGLLLAHVSFQEVITVLSEAELPFLALAVALSFLPTLLRTIRYAFFFPPHGRAVQLFGAFSLSRFLNYALPFRSSEIVFLGILKKNQLSPSIAETAPVWLAIRLCDVIGLGACWALVLATGSLAVFSNTKWVGVLVTLTAISGLMFFAIVWLSRLAQRIHLKSPDTWISKRLAAFLAGAVHVRSKEAAFRTMVLSVIICCVNVAAPATALHAFEPTMTFLDAYAIAFLVISATFLPITAPLGLGTNDALWAGVAALAGIDPTRAVALALAIRAVQMTSVFGHGLIGLLVLVRFPRPRRMSAKH